MRPFIEQLTTWERKMRVLTKAVKEQAQHTVELTIDEARTQPGMLGAILPGHLKANGFYTCTYAGTRTLYVLKGSTRTGGRA